SPGSITAGPDGNVWFTEGSAANLGRITPDGVITEFPIPTIAGSLAVGPDGNLWFTVCCAKVVRMTTSGIVTEVAVPHPASSIASGRDGNLWFTEPDVQKVGRMTTAGVVTEFAVPHEGPFGTVSGPDGNIWFVMSRISCPLRSGCATAGWIGRMTIDGSSVTSFSTGNLVPRNLVTGADGNLWFPLIAEFAPFPPGAGLLASITTSGVITQLPLALATPGRPPEDLTHMTVAPDGNFWVSSLSSNRLFRITPSGTMTAFPLADFDTGANSSQ